MRNDQNTGKMSCPDCGIETAMDARFCSHCGHALDPHGNDPEEMATGKDGPTGAGGRFFKPDPDEQTGVSAPPQRDRTDDALAKATTEGSQDQAASDGNADPTAAGAAGTYGTRAQGTPQAGGTAPGLIGRMKGMHVVFLVSLIGFIAGALIGIFGIIVAMVAALLLHAHFVHKEPIPAFLRTIPGRLRTAPFLSKVIGFAGSFLFLCVLFLPITDYGLVLPTFQNPTDFMKYLSILLVLPENLSMSSPLSAFPGLPPLVLICLIIIIVASLIPAKILSKERRSVLKISGLVLLAIAPFVSHAIIGVKGPVKFEYGIVYYLAWAGIFVELLSDSISRAILGLVRPPSGQGPATSLVLMPVMVGLVLLMLWPSQMVLAVGGADFESKHHTISALIMGLISSLYSGITYSSSTTVPTTAPTPPSMPSHAQAGPQNGDTMTVVDHRGVERELTYDAKSGQWTNEDGNWVDLDRMDEVARQYRRDRAFTDREHERMQRPDSFFNKELDAIKKKHQEFQAMIEKRIAERHAFLRSIYKWERDFYGREFKWWTGIANNLEVGEKGAKYIEKAADTSIDFLATVTGNTGKGIKKVYVFTKDVAKETSKSFAEGKALWKGARRGIAKGIFDLGFMQIKDKFSKVTGGKIPFFRNYKGVNLQNLNKFNPKSAAGKYFKNKLIHKGVKIGIKSTLQSKAQNVITSPVKGPLKRAMMMVGRGYVVGPGICS